MLNNLPIEKWLEYNAKLQKKKNVIRKILKEKGVLKQEGFNKFDNYKYFSEAQYKELFLELCSDNGVECTPTVLETSMFEGTEKQSNGRIAKVRFRLSDIDTGFYEDIIIDGEAIDKGDKALYKAYTGALKYFFADTFWVATGDDAEKDDGNGNGKVDKKVTTKKIFNNETTTETKASEKQVALLLQAYRGEMLTKLLEANNIERIEDISMKKASDLISQIMKKGDK